MPSPIVQCALLLVPAILAETNLLGWQLENQTVRTILLLLGASIAFFGISLMRGHQKEYESLTTSDTDRAEKSARRKYYRRMTGSCVIACVGACLASMYWAVHPRAFALLTLVSLGLLVLLFFVAIFDLFHVGIEAIADPQNEKREELVKEVLRIRKESQLRDSELDSSESAPAQREGEAGSKDSGDQRSP